MDLVIHQTITINRLDVGSVANSSVLQIGTAGLVKGVSNIYNTGGFTGPAPEVPPDITVDIPVPSPVPLVPLPSPTP